MHCKLCLEDKPLCKSHIFPEWIYKTIYDETHKYLVVSSDKSDRTRIEQKGLREKLLCEDCEQLLCDFERYARDAFITKHIEHKEYRDSIIFSGFNYCKFKLFFLSLIWKASISTLKEFKKVNLGVHSERIRQMIFNKDPGESYEYGIIAILPSIDRKLLYHFMLPPEKVPGRIFDGYYAYRSIFCGLVWLFIISSHTNTFSHKEMFLSKDGILPIFYDRGKSSDYIKNIIKSF